MKVIGKVFLVVSISALPALVVAQALPKGSARPGERPGTA